MIEEHTGAAKAMLPSKKKKGIYEERSIAVLPGWVVTNVLEPLTWTSYRGLFIHGIGVFILS